MAKKKKSDKTEAPVDQKRIDNPHQWLMDHPAHTDKCISFGVACSPETDEECRKCKKGNAKQFKECEKLSDELLQANRVDPKAMEEFMKTLPRQGKKGKKDFVAPITEEEE